MLTSLALESRFSTRAFLGKEVPQSTVEKIFKQAQLAPSNCNTQPWLPYVVSGQKKEQLKDALVELISSGAQPNPEFNWNVGYQGVHRERQFGSANTLYSAMGIERSDKPARQKAMLRNWQFFDAPHVVFFGMEKYLDIMGAVDVGIYAQSLALLMTENAISCCMQGALGMYPGPIKSLLDVPEEVRILFGMSFGYANSEANENKAKTDRITLDTSVKFYR